MNNLTKKNIEDFLKEVDGTFPVPLSKKQNLKDFAKKLYEKATLTVKCEGEKILSMAAGYTDNTPDNKGYLSIVATLNSSQGKGYAKKLVKEFIDICEKKGLDAVHLYAVKENIAAVSMYEKLGFSEYIADNETRPYDLHLIYRIKKDKGEI